MGGSSRAASGADRQLQRIFQRVVSDNSQGQRSMQGAARKTRPFQGQSPVASIEKRPIWSTINTRRVLTTI